MFIAKVEGTTVLEVGDYRELFPGTSFPPNGPDAQWMQDNSCLGVTVFKPHDSRTHKLVAVAPYVEDGQVFTVAVEPKTQEELDADTASEAAKVRAQRSRLLADCDWTQLADSPADKAAWAAYRQELRDVTKQADFPWNVAWPAQP